LSPSRTTTALAIAALCTVAAGASEVLLPAPGGPAWQPLEFSKIPRHTRYEPVGEGALRAESRCAASGLLLPLEGIDLGATPRLRWRWKVETPIDASLDERSKQGDDFAARVYVAFAFEPARAGLWERARRRIGAALYGEDLPGSALNYVWPRNEPAGATWPNPFVASSAMVSRGREALDTWRTEEVDLLADYARIFGAPAPVPLFLALMTDTDDTCREARAFYADFRLLGREGVVE
jgi:hypothetical protein